MAFQRGVAHAQRDEFEVAAICFEQTLRLVPEHVGALWNLGLAWQFLGRMEESIAVLRQAIAHQPDLAAAHLNLAMSLFLKGDFAAAWHEYEWRWKCSRYGTRKIEALAPQWQGETLTDSSLLVYGEQGIGDEIMFMSSLNELRAQCARLIVACQARLIPLLKRSFADVIVIPQEALSDSETRRRLGSISYQSALGSTLQFIRPLPSPDTAPDAFLIASDDVLQLWSMRLQGLPPGLNVGISWRGGSEPAEIKRRSTSLAQWAPLLNVPHINFINLQYGVRADELDNAQSLVPGRLHHWPDNDPLRDLDNFAALIASLDLVITVDNSTAHLAGALGTPTWLLISFPSSSYWRWLMEGERSCWYSSLRVFRKQHGESWESLLGTVAAPLASIK